MIENNQEVIGKEVKFEMTGKPDFTMLKVKLAANQTIHVEPTAMAAMDSNIKMRTKARGGILSGIKRMLAKESFFMNDFTAENAFGEIYISPALPGDMEHVALDNQTIIIQSSGYVASTQGIEINTQFQGLKGLFNGEGFFFLQAKGTGDLFFNTYGSIIEMPIDGEHIIDNGHIVAFDETLDYSTEVVGGLKLGLTTFMSGEGIVCRFRGKGRLWVQTRQIPPYINWAWRYAPRKSNN